MIRIIRILAPLALLASALTAQQPARWRLVEEWRVGGAVEGAHFFGDPRGLAVTKDGRIVLFEYKDQQVHFLDARGQPVRSVGRKGAGPGEFREANGLVIAPNGEVIVNDPRNARFTVLSSTGDLVRTVPYVPWGYGRAWEATIANDGRLIERFSYRPAGAPPPEPGKLTPGVRTSMSGLLRWKPDFSGADTIRSDACPGAAPRIEQLFYTIVPDSRSYMNVAYPFYGPRVREVIAADGSEWMARGADTQVLERLALGKCDVIARIRLGEPHIMIPAAVRDSAVTQLQNMRTAPNPNAPDVNKIPRAVAWFDALYVDPSDRVWVERFTGTRMTYTHGVVQGDRTFHVFSPTGTLLASADIPIRMSGRPVAITNDHVYAFAPDDDGLLYLVSLRIVRN